MQKKIILGTIGILVLASAVGGYIFRGQIREIAAKIKHSSSPVECKTGVTEVNSLYDFKYCKVREKSVVIFEPNPYHHECLPGYTKYFTDLGYNVDTLIVDGNQDSMAFFEPHDNVRIFTYDNLDQIKSNSKSIKERFNKYDYILVHTTDPGKKDLYESLGVYDTEKSLFIAHDTNMVKNMGMEKYFDENRVLTLGNFEDGLQVNPHYFGEFEQKNKNAKTRFFITSTSGRKYEYLVEAAKTLKKEGENFEIVVVGRSSDFTAKNIPENLKENFVFKHGLPYKEMYEEVQNSDYVIITLDPENENDNAFKKLRMTGSAQLAYGFLKPMIINKEFAENYRASNKIGFIYEKSTFTDIMRQATQLNEREYKIKQNNLKAIAKEIYNVSFENLKAAMRI